jgi:hypothetical protein
MNRKGTTQLIITFSVILIVGALFIGLAKSCSSNGMAKNFGGSMEIKLPVNTKLVNVTWKESQLWYVTRPMKKDETPETYTFQEKSTLGILEGTITIKESTTSVE